MIQRRHVAGTTLTELMIVVAITGIILMIAPSLIKNFARFNLMSDARLATQRNVREALSHVHKTLRQASADTIEISQEPNQPPYSKISFTTAVDGRSIVYYQIGTKLMFSANGSIATLGDGLRHMAFTMPRSDDPGIISVSVTFEKGTYEGETKALQMAIEKVRIMNE